VNLDDFYRQLLAARIPAAQLYQKACKSFVQQQEILLQSFEELFAALENFEVAEEALRQQNLELLSAYEALAVERQRYQDLFEFIPNAYLVTDSKGIIQEANRAAATLLGVPQQFLVGKPLVLFVSREEWRTFLIELAQRHHWDHKPEWEVCLCPRNGEPIDVTLTASTVRDSEGRLLALHWLLHDITERKQASPALWLLKQVVQQTHEAIVVTSAELDYPGPKVVFVNQAFTRMTGYTTKEMAGKTPRILQGPKTERSVLEQLRRNLLQGQMFHGELINYHKDRTEYNMEFCCTPIRNGRGDITHFVSIQRHVT
jgi:PAS domain S-box-containing protein